MNSGYQEYLKSEHWREFRRNILSVRPRCQNCGTNKQLNLHHKHYKSVGREKNEDVIVLCRDCHFRFHSKKKWLRAKALRKTMDFTRAQHTEEPFFSASDVMRKCPKCAEDHPCFYKAFKNGTLHMAVACPNSKPRTQFIPFEPDIAIPTL